MDIHRRSVTQAAWTLLALCAAPRLAFGRMPMLEGTEPDAVALEFVPDAARIDPVKQPAFVAGSRCAGCYFYQGRPTSDAAPCTVFAGWRVPASGWCREFKRRA